MAVVCEVADVALHVGHAVAEIALAVRQPGEFASQQCEERQRLAAIVGESGWQRARCATQNEGATAHRVTRECARAAATVHGAGDHAMTETIATIAVDQQHAATHAFAGTFADRAEHPDQTALLTKSATADGAAEAVAGITVDLQLARAHR